MRPIDTGNGSLDVLRAAGGTGFASRMGSGVAPGVTSLPILIVASGYTMTRA